VDWVRKIKMTYTLQDDLYTIRGVGGREAVFLRQLDYLQVGESRMPHFEVEIGGMDYGFEINGILGMNYFRLRWISMKKAGPVINQQEMKLEFASGRSGLRTTDHAAHFSAHE
jgi:hypothetical protein